VSKTRSCAGHLLAGRLAPLTVAVATVAIGVAVVVVVDVIPDVTEVKGGWFWLPELSRSPVPGPVPVRLPVAAMVLAGLRGKRKSCSVVVGWCAETSGLVVRKGFTAVAAIAL